MNERDEICKSIDRNDDMAANGTIASFVSLIISAGLVLGGVYWPAVAFLILAASIAIDVSRYRRKSKAEMVRLGEYDIATHGRIRPVWYSEGYKESHGQ